MKNLFVLLFVCTALCQDLTTTAPTRVRVGQSVTVTLHLKEGADPVSGFQFESQIQGWATPLTNKTITCAAAETNKCILIGHNNAVPMVSGPVASAVWVVPSPVPANISFTGIAASKPDGTYAVLTAPPPISLSLIGDVNGDRILNSDDVTAAVVQILMHSIGNPICTTGDQNEDGKCDVTDAQIVVNEALKAQG